MLRFRVVRLVPTSPAVVLGSTQAEVGGAPVPVVRRRSGGGAVWVTPDDPLWVDVDLPADDPRWDDDVARSFHWLGEAWASVLRSHDLDASVHTGAFEPGRWGPLVCFAGRGPGEVFVAGRKVVGLAQRRTRAGARFQCAVPQGWDPGVLIDVVVPAPERERARRELAGVAAGVAVDPDVLVDDLVARLDASAPEGGTG